MINEIRKIKEKGFFHIFGSSVINQIIGFASGIFLVRILTKSDYGLFSYAQNILSFFLLFNGLGTTAGIMQYASETDISKEKHTITKYGLRVGLFFNFGISLLIISYSYFMPSNIKGAEAILRSMFLLPVFIFLYQVIQMHYRVFLENKKFSFLTSCNSILVFILSVSGAYLLQVRGIVYFRYIAYFTTIVTGILLMKNSFSDFVNSPKLTDKIKKPFLKYSIISSFNNGVAQLLYIIDIFIIGIIIGDESIIASYKTATLIPFALKFIPSTIMVFIYPYFAKNNSNKLWIREKFWLLTKILFAINAVISIVLFIFAPIIVRIIFGADYIDSVVPFRILSLGYFIAGTFRIPVGNVIVMMKKVKFALYLSVVTGLLNIILNIFLIQNYGSNGAAVATVSVYIFTSIIGFIYLMRKLKV